MKPRRIIVARHTVAFGLMVSSIILLTVLQMLWLHNSYERAYYGMRFGIDERFRSAVMAVRDSFFLQRVHEVPGDSPQWNKRIVFKDSLHPANKIKSMNVDAQSPQVQIYISSSGNPDSLKSFLLQPIASRFGDGTLKPGTRFVYRSDDDSLSIDSIKVRFHKNLEGTNFDLPFEIKKTRVPQGPFPDPTIRPSGQKQVVITNDRTVGRSGPEERRQSAFGNTLQSQWVRIGPFSRYSVHMSNIRPVLLKEIAPQIFFSGILTFITVMAFIFMYRSIRSQQRLMQLKNDFISNITHELKTPIATVSVALEALKSFKGMDNPKLTGEYLDIAQQELTRLTVLTDKVLTTSLFDEHGVKIEFENVDLEGTIQEAMASLKLVFEKREARVDFNKAGDDFTLEGSNIHLTNVVHNLLDNALKYSPTKPQITLHLKDEGEAILFAVTDKGLGIPAEFHKKIFEKFFRMPTGDVHNIKGYGLGLSYVDSVIKSHHGAIQVSSTPGEGSTFSITFQKKKR